MDYMRDCPPFVYHYCGGEAFDAIVAHVVVFFHQQDQEAVIAGLGQHDHAMVVLQHPAWNTPRSPAIPK